MNIFSTLAHRLEAIVRLPSLAQRIESNQQQTMILQAQVLGELQRAKGRVADLREVEFQAFSQYGEDGILQYLWRRTGPVPEIFVEFGVQNYLESNTRLLLMKDNWTGLIIDASAKYIAQVRTREFHWRHNLKTACAFITKENINGLITASGISGPIGVLSVDIDGNDYWVWEAIDCVDPVIVVAEYNSVFGESLAVTVPYRSDFYYLTAHHSGLYWGASLAALTHLAARKGYSLVGCNSAGNNAFFVRNDRVADLRTWQPQEAFRPAVFRISRDERGALSYLEPAAQRHAIRGLPLVEVTTGQTITFDPA